MRQLFFEGLIASTPLGGDRGGVRINTEMLSLAREAKGFTQKELARRLGCTQSRLSKIESGELFPNNSDFSKFSEHLGQSSNFFFQPGTAKPMSVSFYRKAQTLPLGVLRRCNAEMNVRRLEIERQLQGRKLGQRGLPYLPPSDNRGAKSVAEHLRKEWGMPPGPVRQLIKWVEEAGCIVVEFSLPSPKLDGVSIRSSANVPMIFLNKELPKSRRRLSLAHELGHLIMHTNPHERVEEEAWEFAEEFLMPADEVRAQLEGLNLDRLGRLKSEWGISMQAILQRAKKLGLISDNSHRFLWVQIAKFGYRTNEPFEDLIADEKPTDIEKLLKS